jgi:hypothetical protein
MKLLKYWTWLQLLVVMLDCTCLNSSRVVFVERMQIFFLHLLLGQGEDWAIWSREGWIDSDLMFRLVLELNWLSDSVSICCKDFVILGCRDYFWSLPSITAHWMTYFAADKSTKRILQWEGVLFCYTKWYLRWSKSCN